MPDTYKLQYDGMTLIYPGWNGFISFEDTAIPRNVILNQQTGGTIAATPMSGYDGDIITLSNTADAGYTFNTYNLTGATLTGNQFEFSGSDVTAKPDYTHNVYSVSITQVAGGTIAASPSTGYYGTQVTLTNTPSSEYTFGSYSITGATLTSNKFNFEESNVTAKGSFTQKTYTLTLQTDGHGKLAANKTTGHKGDTVTLTTTANNYYQFNNYSLTGGSVNGNTFTFGSQNATAKANFNLKTSVNVYSNTAYNVTRTPSNNATLSINATAPTANYKVFAVKWQEHWGGGGSIYEMGINIKSNNYTMWESLCKPVPKTACPLWHKSGRTTFPGNYSNCSFTAQSKYNDAYLYKAQKNSSFYTRKLIYNNNNNTISGYLNNTFMFQITGAGSFTSLNSFTYGGNATYPATAYVKDVRFYAFAKVSDAISW